VDNKILNVLGARVFPDEDVPLSAVEFLTVALLGALPWSLSAVVTIVRLLRARAWRQAAETPWIALSLWTLAILGITVLSRFRLPHYGLPVYPALALLAARAWREPDTRWLGLIHAALLGGLSVVGAVLARSDGRAFMDAVIGATDAATRKTRVAGETDPFPGWEMVQPLVAHASLVLGVATVALLIALALRVRVRTSMLAPGVVALAMLAIMPDVAAALARAQPGRSLARRASDRNLRRALALRPAPGALTNQQPRRSASSPKSLATTSQARLGVTSFVWPGPYSVGRGTNALWNPSA